MELSTTNKGDIAELQIALDLMKRGFEVSKPFSSDSRYDLVAIKDKMFFRVQCKYSNSDGEPFITVRCRRTGQRQVTYYTPENIDWLACFDAYTATCYYMHSQMLGHAGRNQINLRLHQPSVGTPTLSTINWASDFLEPPVLPPTCTATLPMPEARHAALV